MRHIRNKFGDVIYCLRDDGTITDKFDCDVIGHLKGDRITDKFDIDTLYRIRPDGTITDKYDCDIIGHIRDDGTITDKYDIDTHGRIDNSNSSSADSKVDRIELKSLIFVVLSFVFILLPPIFFGVLCPPIFGMSWVGILSGVLGYASIAVGLIPFALIFAIVSVLMTLTFIPYHIIVMVNKFVRGWSWKTAFYYYKIWFMKGPLAYKDICVLKKRDEIK